MKIALLNGTLKINDKYVKKIEFFDDTYLTIPLDPEEELIVEEIAIENGAQINKISKTKLTVLGNFRQG
jgi:hypothetical protein